MRKKIAVLSRFVMVVIIASMFWLTACGNSDEEETKETTKTEQESTEENEKGEDTDIAKEFGIEVGENWKYAYNDGTYQFYYLNVSEEVYDRNVVLSIVGDDNLKGVDPDNLKKSLQNQNGEAKVEISEDTVGGNSVVYMEMEESEGDIKACIGQYIVLGEQESLIFSVYAEENKFETARKNTRAVVDTIKIK